MHGDLRCRNIQHAGEQPFHRHRVAAHAPALEKVTVAVPFMIDKAEMMLAVFAVENRLERFELNPIFFVGVTVGLLDIAYDILPVCVGQWVTLKHRTEEFFHRHNVRADVL